MSIAPKLMMKKCLVCQVWLLNYEKNMIKIILIKTEIMIKKDNYSLKPMHILHWKTATAVNQTL